jgi:hypothetical protein
MSGIVKTLSDVRLHLGDWNRGEGKGIWRVVEVDETLFITSNPTLPHIRSTEHNFHDIVSNMNSAYALGWIPPAIAQKTLAAEKDNPLLKWLES